MKHRVWLKFAVLLILVLLLGLFFGTDAKEFFTLAYLKAQKESFILFYEDNRFLTFGIFIGLYISMTALSLPGATVLTLAGGAIFGVAAGTVLVSISSSVGATLAFLASRYLLRDLVETKFGERLKAINEGVKKEGAFYLFTLRLVPVFPFFVINLVMGVTSIRTMVFFLVSQLGMLPGTIVYVNAGTQLGKIESLKDVLSIELIASFVLLGIFPLIAKKLLAVVKNSSKG